MSGNRLRVEALSSVDADEWNAFMLAHAPGNPLLSMTHWADYLTRWTPGTPQFVSVRDSSGNRVAAWLAFFLPLSTLRRGVKRLLSRGLQPWTHEVLWHGAPALSDPALGLDASRALRKWVRECGPSHRFVRMHGGPWIGGDTSRRDQACWATYVVACSSPEESLWSRLKSSARKAVRRARDAGVTVRRIVDRSELTAYYQFVESVGRMTGRRLNGLTELHAGWDAIRPSGRYELFVAERGPAWTAVLGVRGYGVYVGEFGSYSRSSDRADALHSQDLIKWEIIRWANTAGVHSYDLAGVHPHPQTAKALGIRRFKEKWGGEYREFAIVPPHWITRPTIPQSLV